MNFDGDMAGTIVGKVFCRLMELWIILLSSVG